ncbi:hypothetical protein VTJ83DRAFT_6782 [Remersonia thermophila]|uniref:Velvet domain-containing protein n=1 Tax=Remersonia thermophila TaxID=72144 RepID=A0ABR4D7X4_9PEZI
MGAPILASAAHAIPALESSSHSMEASIISRDTKGGRRLWYSLKVIQQPERARACGAGPKSSADRRPVDPPPVVELRIFEGQTWEQAQEKDITFVYNANFFLFVTLEHARVLAHARGTPSPNNTPPVLTGMPVSGMAYLDRPQEAGYFLFPDLSVRHEGRYKLTFNLYEETKEDKDKDKDDSESQPLSTVDPITGGSFDFRMEVKSQDFTVYSAKKFPGLGTSTNLSRVISDQGCRVRIRREVRMRRRGGKGGNGDYENGEDEYSRSRRTATPDNRNEYNRQRSMSGSTERTPYPNDSQRRPSMADYHQHQQQYPQNPSSSQHHLQFMGPNGNPQYPAAAPPQPYQQSSSVPASPIYPPSQQAPTYPSQTSYPAPPPPPPAPRQHSRERAPSQSSSYAPINPAPRREAAQPDYRPAPVQLPPIQPPSYHPATPQQSHKTRHRSTTSRLSSAPCCRLCRSIPTCSARAALRSQALRCSLRPANSRRFPRSLPSPTVFASARQLPPLPPLTPNPNSRGPIHPSMLPPPSQYAGTKRARDETFRTEVDERTRFQDGAREKGVVEDVDALLGPMVFERANGILVDAKKLDGYY